MGIGVLQQPSKQINYLLQVNSPSNINPAHPSDANGPQNYNNIDKLTEQQQKGQVDDQQAQIDEQSDISQQRLPPKMADASPKNSDKNKAIVSKKINIKNRSPAPNKKINSTRNSVAGGGSYVKNGRRIIKAELETIMSGVQGKPRGFAGVQHSHDQTDTPNERDIRSDMPGRHGKKLVGQEYKMPHYRNGRKNNQTNVHSPVNVSSTKPSRLSNNQRSASIDMQTPLESGILSVDRGDSIRGPSHMTIVPLTVKHSRNSGVGTLSPLKAASRGLVVRNKYGDQQQDVFINSQANGSLIRGSSLQMPPGIGPVHVRSNADIFDTSVNVNDIGALNYQQSGGISGKRRAHSLLKGQMMEEDYQSNLTKGSTLKVQNYLIKQGQTLADSQLLQTGGDLSHSGTKRRRSRYEYNQNNSILSQSLGESAISRQPYIPNYVRVPNTESVERMIADNDMLKKELLDTVELMHYKLEKEMIKKQLVLAKNRQQFELNQKRRIFKKKQVGMQKDYIKKEINDMHYQLEEVFNNTQLKSIENELQEKLMQLNEVADENETIDQYGRQIDMRNAPQIDNIHLKEQQDHYLNQETRALQNQCAWEKKYLYKNERVVRFQHQQIIEEEENVKSLATKIKQKKESMREKGQELEPNPRWEKIDPQTMLKYQMENYFTQQECEKLNKTKIGLVEVFKEEMGFIQSQCKDNEEQVHILMEHDKELEMSLRESLITSKQLGKYLESQDKKHLEHLSNDQPELNRLSEAKFVVDKNGQRRRIAVPKKVKIKNSAPKTPFSPTKFMSESSKSNHLSTLDQMSATFIGRLKNSVERGGPIKYPQKPSTDPSTPAKRLVQKDEDEEFEEDTGMFDLTKPPEEHLAHPVDNVTKIENQRREDEEQLLALKSIQAQLQGKILEMRNLQKSNKNKIKNHQQLIQREYGQKPKLMKTQGSTILEQAQENEESMSERSPQSNNGSNPHAINPNQQKQAFIEDFSQKVDSHGQAPPLAQNDGYLSNYSRPSNDKNTVLSPKSAANHLTNEQTFAPESTLAISEGYVTEVPPTTKPLKGQNNSGPSRMLTSPDLQDIYGETSPEESVQGTLLDSRAQYAIMGRNRNSSMKEPSSSMTHQLSPVDQATEIYQPDEQHGHKIKEQGLVQRTMSGVSAATDLTTFAEKTGVIARDRNIAEQDDYLEFLRKTQHRERQ